MKLILSRAIVKYNKTTEEYYPKSFNKTRIKLFNLTADPAEKTNLAPNRTSKVKQLKKLLKKEINRKCTFNLSEPTLSNRIERRLKELGYLK